jgi:hypothetical protein
VRAAVGVGASPDSLPQAMLGWICGVAFVYAALFGVGSFLAGNLPLALTWLAIFLASGFGVTRVLQGFWRG